MAQFIILVVLYFVFESFITESELGVRVGESRGTGSPALFISGE